MVKIKICGITNVTDAVWAANLGVDYIGLVFAKESPRKVSLKMAREIAAAIPPYIAKAGVFVNEEAAVVEKTLAACGLNLLQFHGDESVEYCNGFKGRAKVIKAFRISSQESLENIPRYDTDFYLLDTFVEDIPGGSGQSFNWDFAVQAKEFGRPLFLAGGMNAGNVVQAVKKVNPYAVDVSSGVESSPRRKNVELMREFVSRVRALKI
ncbi:MAG: phosphoribosylanthranilate isomerase [Candidatus Omnitrophota bacterium]